MTGEHIFSNWRKQKRWITFSITKYGWLGYPLLWDPGKEKKTTFVEKFFGGSAVWGRTKGGLPLWLSGKESSCKAGASGVTCSIPGLGRSPGGRHGSPLWYSCLENSMGRGAWQATVHRVAKSWIRLEWLCTHAHKSLVEIFGKYLVHVSPSTEKTGFSEVKPLAQILAWWMSLQRRTLVSPALRLMDVLCTTSGCSLGLLCERNLTTREKQNPFAWIH